MLAEGLAALRRRFPPLYECSRCGAAVRVATVDGQVSIAWPCGHEGAQVYANRSAVLRGAGRMGVVSRVRYTLRVSLKQFLSALTQRSV